MADARPEEKACPSTGQSLAQSSPPRKAKGKNKKGRAPAVQCQSKAVERDEQCRQKALEKRVAWTERQLPEAGPRASLSPSRSRSPARDTIISDSPYYLLELEQAEEGSCLCPLPFLAGMWGRYRGIPSVVAPQPWLPWFHVHVWHLRGLCPHGQILLPGISCQACQSRCKGLLPKPSHRASPWACAREIGPELDRKRAQVIALRTTGRPLLLRTIDQFPPLWPAKAHCWEMNLRGTLIYLMMRNFQSQNLLLSLGAFPPHSSSPSYVRHKQLPT